jgi:hypothetical protein
MAQDIPVHLHTYASRSLIFTAAAQDQGRLTACPPVLQSTRAVYSLHSLQCRAAYNLHSLQSRAVYSLHSGYQDVYSGARA